MKTKISAYGALALLVSACGGQQFSSIATTQSALAPGSLQIAPKVDVVLVEDDTGRISDVYNQIDQQAQSFLSSLDQQGWNYRFTTTRLTTAAPLTQAVASKQDGNWNQASQWNSPYPGACLASDPNCVNPVDQLANFLFRTISYTPPFATYTGFLQQGSASSVLNGWEPGMYTMLQNFNDPTFQNEFLRKDAVLAIVLIGTGNDSSYVNICHKPGQSGTAPCEDSSISPPLPPCTSISQTQQAINSNNSNPIYPSPVPAGACGSKAWSYNYLLPQFRNLKSNPAQVKFFAAVSNENIYNVSQAGQCLANQNAYVSIGTRYQQLASDLGGQSYDVCSQPLSSVLSSVAQNLTTTALNFEKNFIVLKEAPDYTSIQLVKNIGGDPNNTVTIPNDPNNGWTTPSSPNCSKDTTGDYYCSNQPTIFYPTALDTQSGYMIELHGSAILSGADSASITYKTTSGSSVSQ